MKSTDSDSDLQSVVSKNHQQQATFVVIVNKQSQQNDLSPIANKQ
jgi:hypothetical protein